MEGRKGEEAGDGREGWGGKFSPKQKFTTTPLVLVKNTENVRQEQLRTKICCFILSLSGWTVGYGVPSTSSELVSDKRRRYGTEVQGDLADWRSIQCFDTVRCTTIHLQKSCSNNRQQTEIWTVLVGIR